MTTTREITRIAQELIDLRLQAESQDMEKARLLFRVKQDKLYQDDYKTFGDFVSHVGYSRSYAYDLIRVYDLGDVRAAYSELGAAKAITIARLCGGKQGQDVTTEVYHDLIDFAKLSDVKAVIGKVNEIKQSIKPQVQEAVKITEDDLNLAGLMKAQSALIQEKSDLEMRLQVVNGEIGKLQALIDAKAVK